MHPEDIPTYQLLLQKLKDSKVGVVSPEDWGSITRLSFAYIEPRHRFGLLTDALKARIVAARKQVAKDMPPDLRAVIETYHPDRFISSASLLDNLLFGKISYGQADAMERIRTVLIDLFEDLGQSEAIFRSGLISMWVQAGND